ncbi:MAG: hypothetical protein J6P67_02470, partial [Bacteroidaceae bacterium]|nr:hypothetical protein [Bacteroidaceae bacterium]
RFYSLVSKSTGGALSCGTSTSVDLDNNLTWSVTRAAENAGRADQIWALQNINGYKYLYNPQSDCYLGGTGNTAFTQLYQAGNAAYFTFDSVDENANTWTVALNGGSQYLNSYSSTNTGYWSGGSSDANNVWTIKEITEYSATLNSYGFLNVCLPFAVTVPDGYTANVVTGIKKDGDVTFAIMEELTGVVPARTPIILLGKKSTTCKLALVYGDKTPAPTVNLLKGSNLKTTGYTKNTLLSTAATGVATGIDCALGALKASTLTYAAVNKSFLMTADVDNASIAYLTLESDPTPVIDITAGDTDANDDIYDLQGRKVEKTVKGGIYIIKGKKVIK